MCMEKPWHQFYEKGVPRSIDFPDTTLNQMFDEAVVKIPKGNAVSFFGNKISYSELGRQVNQLATALTQLGVKQGDRVAIIMPNIPQYPIAHFAALKIGAVLVPTNPLYVERELKYQINDSEAETAIILDFLAPKILNIKDETGLKNIIVTNIRDYLPQVLNILYPIKAKKVRTW